MAFVWGIEPQAGIEIEVFYDERECSAIMPIGYDDSNDNTISTFVAMAPLPTGDYEIVFCIISADPETASREEYWDGRDTINLFNREDREKVLSILCASAEAVLNYQRPRCVRMYADADIPDKARQKYGVLMGVFAEAGYEIRLGTRQVGRDEWIAEVTN